jgi:hypothetical protein
LWFIFFALFMLFVSDLSLFVKWFWYFFFLAYA